MPTEAGAFQDDRISVLIAKLGAVDLQKAIAAYGRFFWSIE
jgi:hypothetical protein